VLIFKLKEKIPIMKYFMFLLPLAFLTLQASAQVQQVSLADYKPHNEGWLVSIDEAYEQSRKTGKPIMANFTGSDWCGWCVRLTSAVFSKPEFTAWAAKNVVLLELDFPRRFQLPTEIQQQNQRLQQAFQVRGYPTVHVFYLKKGANGYEVENLGQTGYKASVEEFTSGVDMMIKKAK
jgi:thiol-disulfide isomerase/thioredoxin